MRDYGSSLIPAQAAIRLNPGNVDGAFLLAFAYQHLHRDDAAIKAFNLVQPSTPQDQQLIDAGRLVYQARADSGFRQEALAALDRLRMAKTNPDVQVTLVTLYLVLDEAATALDLLDVACAANPLNCNDAAINPIFDPLHGNPRFEELSRKYTTITLE
jgi:tetratricopeptide (TPR) repeat protein